MRREILLPVILAIISVIVMPVLFFCQLGFDAIDLLGLLSIFRLPAVGVDVVREVLSILLLWGTVYLLRIFLKSLPNEISSGSPQIFWKVLVVIAELLSVLIPLGSIFGGESLNQLNSLVNLCAMLAAVGLGLSLVRRNVLFLGIGLALALSGITNYVGDCGEKFLAEFSTQASAEEPLENSESQNSESLFWSLWNLSPTDVDNLDDESIANMQEVSFAIVAIAAALTVGWITLYAASSALFFGFIAAYFVRKKRNLPC